MANVKITKPLRFFGFFGLFLVFLFMAVKTCSERKTGPDFINAGEITAEKKEGGASKEHSKFINKVKKDIKKQEKVQKDLSVKEIEKLEDQNTDKKAASKKSRKAEEVKKNQAKSKKKTPKAKAFKTEIVLVKGRSGKVDSYSKTQLKKNVNILNRFGRGKVMVYGSYFPGEPKAKGFVRAAKIKNELIGAGLKPSISVFVLPEKKTSRAFLGRVKFSK